MNIYKQTAKRLGVFTDVNDEFKLENPNEFDTPELDFYGDATAYEKYLEFEIKKLKAEEKVEAAQHAQQMNIINQQQQFQQPQGYQTSFNVEALSLGLAQAVKSQQFSQNNMMAQMSYQACY